MRSSVGLSFVLLAGAGLGLWFLARPNPQSNALHVRQLATRGLAEWLAQKFPGQRVLVMSNPFTQSDGIASDVRAAEEAGLKGVREGLADQATLTAVTFPPLRPEARENPRALLGDIETTTPLSYLVTPDGFDQVYQQHGATGRVELVVSLIGLPAELERCAIWQAPGAPRFALLWPDLRVVGNTAAVQQSVRTGKLAAFVARKPGAPGDGVPLGKDAKAEFQRRFVLVTADNLDAVTRDYPGLF